MNLARNVLADPIDKPETKFWAKKVLLFHNTFADERDTKHPLDRHQKLSTL